MLLVLDLNENESKDFHEYMDWLDYPMKGYESVDSEVKRHLAELIHKLWKEK